MVIFIHNSKLNKTYAIGDNIYAPSDDGRMDVPAELAQKLGSVAQASPVIDVTPEAQETPEAPAKKK